jgi:hypothetical protein
MKRTWIIIIICIKKISNPPSNLRISFSCYRFFTNIYSRDLYLIAFKKSLDSNFKISDAFVKKIKSIKREKKTNIASHIIKESKFWLTYVYALVIGEKKYHNNRYPKEKSRKSS